MNRKKRYLRCTSAYRELELPSGRCRYLYCISDPVGASDRNGLDKTRRREPHAATSLGMATTVIQILLMTLIFTQITKCLRAVSRNVRLVVAAFTLACCKLLKPPARPLGQTVAGDTRPRRCRTRSNRDDNRWCGCAIKSILSGIFKLTAISTSGNLKASFTD